MCPLISTFLKTLVFAGSFFNQYFLYAYLPLVVYIIHVDVNWCWCYISSLSTFSTMCTIFFSLTSVVFFSAISANSERLCTPNFKNFTRGLEVGPKNNTFSSDGIFTGDWEHFPGPLPAQWVSPGNRKCSELCWL